MAAAPPTLSKNGSEVFVPDGIETAQALSRTTHLGIGAHPDDLEIMAIHGIEECLDSDERWFGGVIVTDGAGSASGGRTKEELASTRRAEQKRAAELGRYGAVVFLNYSSAEVRGTTHGELVGELAALLRKTTPGVVYTHNLADSHDTHVAVALAVIAAVRSLGSAERPGRVIGCEVWRGLDWLPDEAKVAMPVGSHEDLEAALVRAFVSQLEGGKRYDEAALGRRRANATFHAIREADGHPGLVLGMDLTPAARGEVEPSELVRGHLLALERDVLDRLRRFER